MLSNQEKRETEMADTSIKDETVTQGDSQTEVTNTSTPPQDNAGAADVERLQKELEKANLRNRQLENEKSAREKADEEKRLKQLEENNEWKSVAEQERAKREALEQEREAETKAAELSSATSELFSQFPAEVVEIAQETGLSLNEVTEEAKEALKSKLEKIQGKVVTDKRVTPNNPSNQVIAPAKTELIQRMRAGDREAREEVISNLESVKAMKRMAGMSE